MLKSPNLSHKEINKFQSMKWGSPHVLNLQKKIKCLLELFDDIPRKLNMWCRAPCLLKKNLVAQI